LERSGDEITLEEVAEAGAEAAGGGPDAAPALTGMTAARGRAVGTVRVILAAPQVHRLEVGDVLVTSTSTPDAMGGESVFPTRAGPPLGIGNAAAIVTDEGGSLSHAAIVAREQGIPCIVGTEHATTLLTDGQVVEIDATRAEGRIIPLS
ncbi:MAG: PEP-utilizing enzyme, partial [Actinomycetota bacterium]